MEFDIKTLMIDGAPTYEDGAMYLKTAYRSNKERFEGRFIEVLEQYLTMNDVGNAWDIVDFYRDLWDKVKPFTYQEAFELEDEEFRATVFSVIDVPEMVKNLGHDRIKTEGIKLKDRAFNHDTGEFETIDLDQVYELHRVNGDALNASADLFAVRAWCTSTNEEHWLWVTEEVGREGSPLAAIASTCIVYEGMIGKIKHIIRQGDVFLFEMIDEEYIPKEGELRVPIGTETYFKLLKSQS